MTDELREENRPEEEEVEGHGATPGTTPEKHQLEEDDDVEAHAPGTPAPTTPRPGTP
jgi:hypothetical protein